MQCTLLIRREYPNNEERIFNIMSGTLDEIRSYLISREKDNGGASIYYHDSICITLLGTKGAFIPTYYSFKQETIIHEEYLILYYEKV